MATNDKQCLYGELNPGTVTELSNIIYNDRIIEYFYIYLIVFSCTSQKLNYLQNSIYKYAVEE